MSFVIYSWVLSCNLIFHDRQRERMVLRAFKSMSLPRLLQASRIGVDVVSDDAMKMKEEWKVSR